MSRYSLDTARVRHGFERAAARAREECVVQRLVREELLARLDVVAIDPQLIVDAGAGAGHALRPLRTRYPRATLLAFDSARVGLTRGAAAAAGCLPVIADTRALPLPDACTGLLFSSLLLPSCDDPDTVLTEWRRVMAPGGLLSFSTLGPDTLSELRRAWGAVDDYEHVHGFIDMHDIGDALLRHGFADPVLDVERYTLTYPGLRELLAELRSAGSTNALPGRPRGLLSRERFSRLADGYARFADGGRLPATVEVVYGHAWCPTGPARRNRSDDLAVFPAHSIPRRR